MEKIAILIPTLNPDIKIIRLVKELKKLNLENIFIVNDGSEEETSIIFDKLKGLGCVIYNHEVNKGKGAAIKTGLKNIEKIDYFTGVVTVDGDGQHLPKDIVKVAEKLLETDEITLGTRVFDNKNMPLKNRIGNSFSAFYFKTMTGVKLNDTQTGLRGIPVKYIPFSLLIPGQRFEYEMRFLEKAANKKLKIQTVNIEAVYEEDWTTHFRPIHDSFTIYKDFFKNIFASLSSAMIDVGLFIILATSSFVNEKVIIATIIARLISGGYNFTLNKIWTFEQKDSKDTKNEGKKYIILCLGSMLFSGIFTQIINNIFIETTFGLLILKIIIDLILFFVNFVVQKKWVFNKTIN